MRFYQQNTSAEGDAPATGSLLIAHPMLQDPHFRRTVIFLASHDSAEGTLGLVMNRAMNKTLGELETELSNPTLAAIPLYEGGPVASDKLILAAWRWVPEQGSLQLYFGIDSSKAEHLLKNETGYQVRGFMGHAGWTEGQLDFEMEQQSWLVASWSPELMEEEGEQIWRNMLLHKNPAMRLLIDAPDDPSRN
ncbi:YqgE/AlgH family protein [Coraliomargarita sinensis]|uniref:YqgE/AlgH family protein n=1 Tax=Coraliomargarita sinensis TaxID=2174842 RepID=A0A317ZJC9_9BACT|nr:YqgE/AlgH family protein [Coraliomargarita sinensis]PXA05696.1 YqgE/AlgH family protein [Coraliomargarita sinensis]